MFKNAFLVGPKWVGNSLTVSWGREQILSSKSNEFIFYIKREESGAVQNVNGSKCLSLLHLGVNRAIIRVGLMGRPRRAQRFGRDPTRPSISRQTSWFPSRAHYCIKAGRSVYITNNKAKTDSGWRGLIIRHARWSMHLINKLSTIDWTDYESLCFTGTRVYERN